MLKSINLLYDRKQNDSSKQFSDLNKSFHSLGSSRNFKGDPFIKVDQVSVVDYLKGDDSDTVKSQTKASQNILYDNSASHQMFKQTNFVNSSFSMESDLNDYGANEGHENNGNKSNSSINVNLQISQSDEQSAIEGQYQAGQQSKILKNSMSQTLQTVSKQKRKNNVELESIQSRQVWQKKWLVILFYISKFMYAAKWTKKLFRPFLLTAFQLKLIGDITSNQESKKQAEKYNFQRMMSYSKFSRLLTYKTFRKVKKKVQVYFSCIPSLLIRVAFAYHKIIEAFFRNIPLINYLSTFYIIWEAIIFICSFINFIYLPFEFSFSYQRNFFFQIHISVICPIIYSIDIFIKANTQTFQQGTHLQQHKQILKEYITTSFFSDAISLLSLNQQFFAFKGVYFLFFLRLFRSSRILDIFREQFFSRTQISAAIYFGHIFACSWHYVGSQSEKGWIDFYQLKEADLFSHYIYSYYFAVVSMTTIGYGDLTAQTNSEKLVMIFMAFISCGVFGYTINSIGNILSDFKQKSDRYLTELAKLNKYFKQYEVSLTLQANARRYLQFIHQEEKQDKISTLQSLNNLSEYLQNNIKMDVITRKLKLIEFFRDNFKEEALLQLSLLVQEKIYQPDQVIVDQNEIKEPAIYIINHGRVVKYSQFDLTAKQNEITELKEKEIFGLIEFFTNKENSEFNYKSKELTSIYCLSLSSFLKVIQQDNDNYEQFCYLRDQVIFSQALYKIKQFCESCKSKNHTVKDCPCIFYKARHITIVRKHLKVEKDYNYEINRKQSQKQNSLSINQYVNKRVIEFQYDNLHQLSMYDQSFISDDDNNNYIINNNSNNNNYKINEEKEYKRSQKTSEIYQEEEQFSELEKNIDIKSSLIAPRRKHHFDRQKTEDSRKLNSYAQIEEDDSGKQGVGVLSNYSKKQQSFQSFPSMIPGINQKSENSQYANNKNNVLQGILQHINELQQVLTSNSGIQKNYIKSPNLLSQQGSPRKADIGQLYLQKKDNFNLNGSVTTYKNPSLHYIKQMSKFEQEKLLNDTNRNYIYQEFDRMGLFKIYYPQYNYDKAILKANTSMNCLFKIPQTLKRLKLKRKNFKHTTRKLVLCN